MMKKQAIIVIVVCVIVGFIIGLTFGFLTKKDDTVWITDNEFLYNKAVQYIINENTNNGYDKDKKDYKVFAEYEKFGIEEKNNKKYAYMWILEESYYVENNEIKSSSGSSMPYKFVFENDEVVKYEIPKDGSYWVSSVKEMMPDSIENKVINFNISNDKLEQQVNEYYSYLKNEKSNTIEWNEITETGVNEELLLENIDTDLLQEIAKNLQEIMEEEAKEEKENPELVLSEGWIRIFDKEGYKKVINIGKPAIKPLYYILYKSPNNGQYEYLCAIALQTISGITFEGENGTHGWSTAKQYLELFTNEILKQK